MSDAAIVGQAPIPMPDAEPGADVAEGEWIHIQLSADGVQDIHRPDGRSWHETVDLLLVAAQMARTACRQ